MTLYQFNALAYEDQLTAIDQTGSFLATRWEAEAIVVLYHLPGELFVELCYDATRSRLVDVQAFTSPVPLAAYIPHITLPQGTDALENK